MSSRFVLPLLCVTAWPALAQDGGVNPVLLGPGDFPSKSSRVPIALALHDGSGAGAKPAHWPAAPAPRAHERTTMTVWREARGAAVEALGTMERWLGSMTRSKALEDRGSQHLTRGAGLRGGPATHEVARRQAIILKRIANAKVMRAARVGVPSPRVSVERATARTLPVSRRGAEARR